MIYHCCTVSIIIFLCRSNVKQKVPDTRIKSTIRKMIIRIFDNIGWGEKFARYEKNTRLPGGSKNDQEPTGKTRKNNMMNFSAAPALGE